MTGPSTRTADNPILFMQRGRLCTRSLLNGAPVPWDPLHSKVAALISMKIDIPLERDARVLYLGGGHGTTVSHLSDLIPGGRIYVVEFGTCIERILEMSGRRPNIFPIMEDASMPSRYRGLIEGDTIDVLCQDISQRHQYAIFRSNLGFLRKEGFFIIMIKARSISQQLTKSEIAEEFYSKLEHSSEVQLLGMKDLRPYHKGHIALYGRRKGDSERIVV